MAPDPVTRATRWRAGGRQVIPRPADARLAEPFVWPRAAADAWTTERIGAAVRRRVATDVGPLGGASRPSAVLVLVADAPGGAEVLLTRRSEHLSSHRGEISFPGGRLDPDETFEVAALREATEEVDLDSRQVRVVGRLDPLNTLVSHSYIVPVLAVAGHRPPVRPATGEVDTVFWVPLADLARADTFREEWWGTEPHVHSLFFYELDDETVWGATARILTQLLTAVLGQGPPAMRTAP